MIIMIVEDDFLQAYLLKAELSNAGYTVVGPVATVQDGLDLAEEQDPDLAIVDINLKNGGKGTELARELARRGVPSLFLSGQIIEARQNRDVALGYINKPYRAVTVLSSIDVAKALIGGQDRPPLPAGLELF